MLLNQLVKNIKYTLVKGNIDIDICDVIYDSRKVVPNSVFVCLKGYTSDGHKYIDNAIQSGATAVVICDDIAVNSDVTVIKVNDSRLALAYMSAEFFGNPSNELKTIAITGTKGKTSTVAMIKSILEKAGIKTGTIGTLGIVIGDNTYKTNNTTPESYEVQQAMRNMINQGCKAMIIEASSLGLKWNRVAGINFDIGVFTNFSNDHIGDSEHKDINEYLSCKALLFKQCKIGIVNADDNATDKVLIGCSCKVLTYGIDKKADYIGTNDRLLASDNFIGVAFDVSGKVNFSTKVSISGRFSVYNALASIAVADVLGISQDAICDGLGTVTVKGRVEAVPTNGDYTLLIDYAHNAVSMQSVLSTLREYKPNRLITMFGAGGNRPKIRRYEMGEVSGRMSDLSVITEDNSRFEDVKDIIADILVGINKTNGKYVVIENRAEAIKYCISIAQKGDIIVLAGKGHEDYQEIKGVKYHFDEREVIADILNNK